MIDIERLRSWDDPGELVCAEAAAEIGVLRRALEQIAMEQTVRTPEQAVAYFQHIAREVLGLYVRVYQPGEQEKQGEKK